MQHCTVPNALRTNRTGYCPYQPCRLPTVPGVPSLSVCFYSAVQLRACNMSAMCVCVPADARAMRCAQMERTLTTRKSRASCDSDTPACPTSARTGRFWLLNVIGCLFVVKRRCTNIVLRTSLYQVCDLTFYFTIKMNQLTIIFRYVLIILLLSQITSLFSSL